MIDVVSNYGITFVVSIVLARLLTPDEYGIVGTALIFIALGNCFVDSGMGNAIIRKQKVDAVDYSTVFISNMCISAAVTAILYLCAPSIALFFKMPTLTQVIRVLSFIIVINALAITQRTRMTKNIDFKTQALISLPCTIASGIIGIIMAVKGFGVWALVGQQLSRQILDTILLWIVNRGFPRLVFSFRRFKSLFGFGWKILVSGLIQTIWRQAYPILIGKCYGSATLGQYTRAYQFCSIVSENMTSVIQRVSFPSLSSIQDDPERLLSAYKRVIRTTMAITSTSLLGLCAAAPSLIVTMIGPQWLPSIRLLQILCISMLFYPLTSINSNMLQIHGRSDWFLKVEIIQKILALSTLAIGIAFNIYWMLVSSIATNFISFLVAAHYSTKLTRHNAFRQIKDLLPEGLIAASMALVVHAVLLLPVAPYIQLSIQIIVGAAWTIVWNLILKLPESVEIRNIIGKIVHRPR